MNIKPFYVCDKCVFHDLDHFTSECKGNLKPAFLADDVERLIRERLEAIQKVLDSGENTEIAAGGVTILKNLLTTLHGDK